MYRMAHPQGDVFADLYRQRRQAENRRR